METIFFREMLPLDAFAPLSRSGQLLLVFRKCDPFSELATM
jgi:hypothetical protein